VARARRSFRRTRTASGRDLVWITTVVRASVLETTPIDIGEVVVPQDWSNGNVGFDRATLLSVRGQLSAIQVANSTATEIPGFWGAMYLTDDQIAANSMDPSNATEYVQFDTIWTFCGANPASSGSTPFNWLIDIRAKRKLTTQSAIRCAVTVGSDLSANPRVSFVGLFRALLQLDPAR